MGVRPQGVFLDLATIDAGDIDLRRLQPVCVDWAFHAATSPPDTAARIRAADSGGQ